MTCTHCGKKFVITNHSAQRYCSQACWYASAEFKAINLGSKRYDAVPDTACQHCGVVFHPANRQRKFCSRECWRAYKTQAISACATCGKGKSWARRHTQTCSRECGLTLRRRSYMRGSIIRRTGASISRVKGYATTMVRIGKLVCERCGFDVVAALVVHHRDRDRSNNLGDNLETLCANCHAIEHRDGKTDDLERRARLRAEHMQ